MDESGMGLGVFDLLNSQDEYLENAVKYGVANNFAKVVQLKTLKAIEKIKSLDEETFFGLTSFVGEQFTLKLGKERES